MYSIVKIDAIYCDEQSVINIDNNNYYYLPNENIRFEQINWKKNDIKVFNETFEKLDNEYFLVLKPVVIFNILNILTINNNTDYDEFSLNEISLKKLYDDFKKIPKFNNFNNCGIAVTTFSILIKENWSYCYDDWDCWIEYIGIIQEDKLKKLEEILIK